jgi:hypothetical protein
MPSILIICIALVVNINVTNAKVIQPMQNMRTLCAEAQNNSDKATEFHTYMNTVKCTTAITKGYKAMSFIMVCKHSLNPFTKLSYFNKGKTLLEQAIKEEPDNIELIFFRFITQRKAPSMLNYYSNKVEDKQKITVYLKQKESTKEAETALYKTILKHLHQ